MNIPKLEPLIVPVPEAKLLIGVKNTKFWQLVKDGKIDMVEVGGRRMPTYASLKRLAQPKHAA